MSNMTTTFPQTYQIQFSFQFDVTQRLLALARMLPENVYYAQNGYSHDSIHNTFCHAVGAAKFWREVMTDMLSSDFDSSDPMNIADIAGLVSLLASERKAWHGLLATCDDVTLLGTFKSDSPIGPRVIPVWRTLQHVILHTMQHHTELAHMLTAAGHSPGDLDFFWDEAAT